MHIDVGLKIPNREVPGSIPTGGIVFCPWARQINSPRVLILTLEAVAPFRHERKIFRPNVENCPGFPPPLVSRRLRSRITKVK